MPSNTAEKIDGISSIIKSQINHYNIWNGRFFAHSIVQFFMQYEKIVFNIFNSMAFVMLGLIINSIVIKLCDEKTKSSLFVVFGLMWLLLPDFGKTVLWISGSGNYLWMSIFYTAFILFTLSDVKNSAITILSSIVLGFLAGATNENSGPAAILVSLMIVVFHSLDGNKIKYYGIVGVISSCFGSYLIISAPGSKRMGGLDMSLDIIIKHFITIFEANITLFSIAYVVIISFIIHALTINKLKSKNAIIIFIFMIGHFSSLYSMIFSPYFVTRTAFGSSVFLIITMVYLFNIIKDSFIYNVTFTSIVAFISFIVLCVATNDIRRSYFEVRYNKKILENSKHEDEVKLIILTKSGSSYNAYNGTSNITPYKQAWFNQWMAKYYGVKSITGINK